MDIKEKQKTYILFGILGIIFFIVYYNFLLAPQFSRFIVNNREFYAVKKRVGDAEILIANEQNIKYQYENLKKQEGIFEKMLPAQDEISSLLEDFSGIAESSAVRILKIQPMEAVDDVSQNVGAAGSPYSSFPILIEARAGYHQCAVFINKLENMDRFIKVEEIDIRENPKDFRRHDIRLEVVTYIMR